MEMVTRQHLVVAMGGIFGKLDGFRAIPSPSEWSEMHSNRL